MLQCADSSSEKRGAPVLSLHELEARAREILFSAGIIPRRGQLDCSGEWIKAGTEEKPRSSNGRYKLHLDWPPNISHVNYNRGGMRETEPLYTESEQSSISDADRKAWAVVIRQENERKVKARQEREANAAQKAQQIYNALPLATDDNPYCRRKGIKPVGNVRQDDGLRLVVPMLNEQGEISSLQYISPDGRKINLSGGRKKGCYSLIPASKGCEAKPVAICEGYSTGASINMATGYETIVAFGADNLQEVGEIIQGKYPPEREVIIAGDYDIQNQAFPEPGGKGKALATRAAAAIGTKVAICKPIDEGSADFNDYYQKYGPMAVAEIIEHAQQVEASPFPANNKQDWGEPIAFSAMNIPRLDVSKFPPLLADYVKTIAESKQVPVELPFAMTLAAVAIAAQRNYRVAIREDYSESVNLYVLCPLPPGERKSAVVAECSKPLLAWEEAMMERLEPVIRQARSERLTLEKAIDNKRTQAAKAKTREDRKALQEEINELESELQDVPQVPRLIAQNITPEELGHLMAANQGYMGILSAEGGLFDILAGMYSGGIANLDLFLQAHSGDMVRLDRRSAHPIMMNDPCLSIGMSPQPVCLTDRSAARLFRLRGLDGRFLYFLPESLLGKRKVEPPALDMKAVNMFNAKISALLPTDLTIYGIKPTTLELSRDAYQSWLQFAKSSEDGLREEGEFGNMRDWAGKLPGAVARIAALLHIIASDSPQREKISDISMRQAVYLGAFLAEHAKAAYSLMGADPDTEDAKQILKWIKRHGKESFTVRECHIGVKQQTQFHRAEAVKAALQILVEREYLRESPQQRQSGGRPPSPVYEANPVIFRKAGI